MSEQSEECECEECESGAPAWMATFADLMSLLMCFFVLLLSFSEMDVQKYKQVAGSMKFAFGIQKKIKVDDIPKGTSIIAREFTPGRPDPTPIKVINQHTVDDFSNSLRTINAAIRQEVQDMAKAMVKSLSEEIHAGVLDLVMEADSVRVRIRENDSFPSGSAKLQKQFFPILARIAGALKDTEGRIVVAGHTDNVPISTQLYPSNWVLSSARAATVVHHLAEVQNTDPSRMEIRAYADTVPVVPNDTEENKAKNRRVEIIVNYDNYPVLPYELRELLPEKEQQLENGETAGMEQKPQQQQQVVTENEYNGQ